jgi:hypothetical protein
VCSAAVAAVLLLSPPVTARGGRDPAREFLAGTLRLTPAELARLDRGTVVTRYLDPTDKREVAVQGVVRIGIPPAVYLERLRDIVSFKRHEAVLEIGVFGDIPSPGDMAGLTLDRGDLRDLRACRVGDCDWKLPGSTIRRLQKEVPWGTAEGEARAHAIIREELTALVAAYRRDGDRAAMRYDSGRRPVDLAEEFRALLDSDSVLDAFPGIVRYVREYPRGRDEGIHDLIYWSREKAGPSAVVSMTHMIFAPAEGLSGASHVVMSRQIYGSRYFDASMGLTIALPDGAGDASFVAYVNRSRVDVFGGLLGGIVRRTVRSRVRTGMSESLARVKVRMEQLGSASGEGTKGF